MTTSARDRWLPLLAFAGAWFLAILAFGVTIIGGGKDGLVDANTYWSASRGPMYSDDYVLWTRGYSYPPPFAQLFALVSWPPYEIFRWIWLGVALLAYTWLLRPVRPVVAIPLIFAAWVLCADNLYWILALVAVFSFRFPSLWAVPLLTKITPGVGVLWFPVRGEWRSFAIALASTALVAGVSVLIVPELWAQWLSLMLRQDIGGTGTTNFFLTVPPLTLRVAVAAVLVAWGARTDRRWVIPVSMLIAQPDIAFSTFGVLAAIPRLRQPEPAPRPLAIPQGVAA